MRRKIKKISYKDLKDIITIKSNESLVDVATYDKMILSGYEGLLKPENLPDNIVVRDSIAQKLANANKRLMDKYPHLSLKVVYGYRPLEVQTDLFEQVMQKVKLSGKKFESELALFEEIHKSIAVPSTAGHPAGAAVDITIFNRESNDNLDMGSRIDDFDDEVMMTWFAEGLKKNQMRNRELLLRIMLAEQFAPFWGEWWHYSFGDREWAVYYGKKKAIFDTISSY